MPQVSSTVGRHSGAELIRAPAFRLDPGVQLTRVLQQRLGDLGLQLVRLLVAQAACDALVAEACRPLRNGLQTTKALHGLQPE